MNRIIEVHSQEKTNTFEEKDLPLALGSGEDAQILLPDCPGIVAYIGQSKGHLFLQPAGEADTPFQLYHNDEYLTTSVWIKSGDKSQLNSQIIQYTLSGDRVILTLVPADHKQPVLSPPASAPPARKKRLPRVKKDNFGPPQKKNFLFRFLFLTLFLLLLCGVLFVLLAKPFTPEIEPQPDSLTFKGFPPPLKFKKRYLAFKGSYTLLAEKKGYKPLKEEIKLSGEESQHRSFRLEKEDGLVSVSSKPADDVAIVINGKELGQTPLSNKPLPAGEHRLQLTKTLYKEFSTSITVEGLGKKQHFTFTLSPAWGDVHFTTKPTGADIYFQKKLLGKTPVTVQLPEGRQSVSLQKKNYDPLELQLDVQAGKKLTPAQLTLQLTPASITINSSPTGAAISVNNSYRGITPITLAVPSSKQLHFALSKDGYDTKRQTLQLTPGEKKTIKLSLAAKPGTLFITSTPPDAQLSIDGKNRGRATGRQEISVGKHNLLLEAPGYLPLNKTITVQDGFSQHIDLELQALVKPAPKTSATSQVTTQEQTPIKLPKEQEIHTKKPAFPMILLQGANFTMGASRNEAGRRANERLRKVKISRPYYLAPKLLTNKEYRQFKPGHNSGQFKGKTLNEDKQPVVNVSWPDAARYLNWLSRKDGLQPYYKESNKSLIVATPETSGYRLPSEAEWAFGARLGPRQSNAAKYPWQGTFPPPAKSGNYGDESARTLLPVVLKRYNDTFPTSSPVASFSQNQNGLFDIGGNVSEWCHDFYTPYGGFGQTVSENPVGPATGTHHVVRGSSWRDATLTELRLSYRSYSKQARDDIGFRVARYQ